MDSTRKGTSNLRIVVQYVPGNTDSPWHLVAYGNGRAFQPRRFRSVEDLLTVIRSAMPDFDPSLLAVKSAETGSHIVWAGDIAMSDSQLLALGLEGEIGPKS